MTNIPLGGFTVQTATVSDDRVLHYQLSGKMEGTQHEYAFLDSFRSSLADGVSLVAFDFADVGYLNSSGIGVIVSCVTAAHEQEKTCCFVRMPAKISDLFHVVGLFKLVKAHDDIDTAIGAHLK